MTCGNRSGRERCCVPVSFDRRWPDSWLRKRGVTWARGLIRAWLGVGGLAISDDSRLVGGHVPVLPDEGDLGGVRFGEVDDDDGVFGEVHLAFDGRSGVSEFAPAEIADEDGVLEGLPA